VSARFWSQHSSGASPALVSAHFWCQPISGARVFGQSYVANCSSVDGQAAFRDEESDHRHIEYFQRLEKFHEEGFKRDPQFCELQNQVQTAGDNTASKKAKSCLTSYYKKLWRNTLRQFLDNWVRERRDCKILTRGKEAAKNICKTDFVHSICLLILEPVLLRLGLAWANAIGLPNP
jgi:hypothetical protein